MLEAYNDKPILVSFHAKYCGAMWMCDMNVQCTTRN
jgi:hypothetical protein